ncbi:hypothetical protein RAC90_11785 [Pantoea sp. CS_6]|uniref:hypothetical protein n=1 Tax=unclassified Pantoea TaxID=2630326 RepID=UPI0035C0D58E
MKKRIFLIAGVAVLAATTAYGSLSAGGSRPDFVTAAENKTNNFLQYSYGKGKCKAAPGTAMSWDMECKYDGGKKVVKFALYSAEHATKKSVDTFYLVAKNQAAVDSASTGMGQYLPISTQDISSS